MRTILDVNLTFINNQKVKRKREMEKMSPDFGSIWELRLRDILFEGWFVGCKTKIKEYFPLFCNKLFEIRNIFHSYKVSSSNISFNIKRTFKTYLVSFHIKLYFSIKLNKLFSNIWEELHRKKENEYSKVDKTWHKCTNFNGLNVFLDSKSLNLLLIMYVSDSSM